MSIQDVLIRKSGRVLHITLNRPRVINALTPAMSIAIEDALVAAIDDPDIEGVLLDGAGERGLCAGGDINMSVSGDYDGLQRFWEQEYRLDLFISKYPKPYIAFMEGITMGGGIGLSAHASHRIVSERSRLALPEVRIGFIPDVGGTHILANAPGELGTHLGLTAGDMTAGDAIACGFADYFVSEDLLADLKHRIIFGEDSFTEEIKQLASPAPDSNLLKQQKWIDDAYSANDIGEVLARLDARSEPEAHEAATIIRQVSPTSVVITLAALRKARELNNLASAFDLELRIGAALLRTFDMGEGVRAQIIDKDRNPQWQPAHIADVDKSWVASLIKG
ncbi:enoyl-CoA hydratase [Leucobacter exalbidus]|uniref:3-hydroxyisobutyryl-CoA hydrolase n=1 Tax=Leucobacter exalbidus TaxID=662960 RepID=A0A940T5B8_9MICO|nr:enoyl-CoA hydratase/isomerase family protein [Leucobacter exalbidus]MBP1325831.1 enoyl-CoA hydratase [Leucobacter exalbidus]